MPRSPWWIVAPPVVALGAGVTRWLIQGSGNVYTATTKRFYVPDPDLGWRVSKMTPLWLGLEVLAIIAAIAAGIAVALWLVRRWERKRGAPIVWARAILAVVGVVPLAIPLLAFASGLGPAGGRDILPEGATAAAPVAGLEGSLPLPAGRYEVVPHAGTSITAKISAGKETFDARFGSEITGALEADLADLTKPVSAEIAVAAKVVDTGIGERSDHARSEYLAVAKFPRIALRLVKLVAARQDRPDQVAFRAAAELDFLGEKLPVEVTGNLRAADAAAKARLGLGDAPAALVTAYLEISVKGSGLRSSDSFEADRIPLTVSLVLSKQR
jgi:hypothetical protein